MTDDDGNEPANIQATGDGATAINAGDGATVNVDKRVGVSISGQTGDVTIGTVIVGDVRQTAPLRALLHDHSGFIASRLEAFVGREAELAEIRRRIAGLLPTGGYVTIAGHAGQGKSSVIAKLVADELGGDAATMRERLQQPAPGVPVCHFIPFSPGPDHQVGLLRNLIARLCLAYTLPDSYAASESRPALRDYFAAALRDMAKQGRQEVIYVDGLDQIEEDASGVRDLSFLPEEPPAGIVFVLGTRPNDTLKPLELRKPQHEYWLPALSREDFDLILQHRGVTLTSVLADRFYAAMQENALYLDLVARELAQADAIEPEQIIARVADNPANLFSLGVERLQRNERQWEAVLRPVLGLLLVARAPLSHRALRALIGADELRTRQGLQRLGGLVQRDGEGRYGLFHLKLGDFLRHEVFAADEEADYHGQLAGWCESGKGASARSGAMQATHWSRSDAPTYGSTTSPTWRRRAATSGFGAWSMSASTASGEAVNLAELLSDPVKKTETLCAIGVALLERGVEEGARVLRRARTIADTIADEGQRAEVLSALAEVLAAAQCWDDARAAVDAIPKDGQRAEALITLTKGLAAAQCWGEARATSDAISDNGAAPKPSSLWLRPSPRFIILRPPRPLLMPAPPPMPSLPMPPHPRTISFSALAQALASTQRFDAARAIVDAISDRRLYSARA